MFCGVEAGQTALGELMTLFLLRVMVQSD